MKKQLLLTAAFTAAMISANAQTWTFESLPDGQVTAETDQSSLNGLVINTSKVWTVETNEKTFNDAVYTKRLKSGGAGRSLTIPVTGPGIIEIAALSASNNEPARTYNVGSTTLSTNEEGTVVSTEYTGNAGNVTITSNAGVNFYSIKFTANGEQPVVSNKMWNMADYLTVAEDFYDKRIFEGLVVTPGTDPTSGNPLKMTAALSAKSFNWNGAKTSFGAQLKAAGDSKIDATTQMPGARIIKFKPTSNGTISLGALTGSTGADRYVVVSKFNNGTLTQLGRENTNLTAGTNGFEPIVINYDSFADGDEIWIYAEANLAYSFIHFSGSVDDQFNDNNNPSGISANNASKAIVATEYYNIAGLRLSVPTKGLNLVKNIMEDDSVEVVKVYVK